MRWKNSFLEDGQGFNAFWAEYLKSAQREVLIILGTGFDPRTNESIKVICSDSSLSGKRHCRVVRYFESSNKVKETARMAESRQGIEKILKDFSDSKLEFVDIFLKSPDNKSIASREAASKIVVDLQDISAYTDIIVDISAMPRSIYFSLINKLLNIIDENPAKNVINLHIVVSENASLDAIIKEKSLAEEASFVHGLSISDLAKTQDFHKVWIPILGENQAKQLGLIGKFVDPVETCPLLPFPSRNLRRGDELITTYQRTLFSELQVDAKNIIYADEQNPFQVYRLLLRTIDRYQESFSMLRGCKIIISALSSKLLSVGALLAVYESKKNGKQVGLAHVESFKHEVEDQQKLQECLPNSELFEIWITGEPYDEN
jgi:hypothetical protein